MPSVPSPMPIVEVDHVTKEFQLGQLRSLKQTVLDAAARLRGHPVPERAPFKALNDVTFKVDRGEVLGIIGQNGAGKSTLLKLLAGISKQTSGTVVVNGKVAPLIEVGAGLVPDLTGRENIRLNATILGLKKAEIAGKFDDIVAFAELQEFIDTPIKRYSSGMQVRLGFAIATSVESDILIVDEVLAVGDLAFQRKCFDRMEELIKEQGRTVLLVSHNIRQVERICTRAILLDHGKIVANDDPRTVCNLFYERSEAKIRSQLRMNRVRPGAAKHINSGEVVLLKAAILDHTGAETDSVPHGSDITVSVLFKANTQLNNPMFGVGFHTPDFLYLATKDSEDHVKVSRIQPGLFSLRCRITKFPLLAGIYALRIGVGVGNLASTVFYAENVLQFQVRPDGKSREQTMREGFISLDTGWHVQEEPGSAESAGAQRLLSRT